MRKEIRDISGFMHSSEAVEALEHVFLTAKQAAVFYEELRRNGSVILYGVTGCFFLRDDEVCYSPNGQDRDIVTTRHTETIAAGIHTDEGIRTFQCSNLGCKREIQVEKEQGVSRRRPRKIRCPGCGRKLTLPLGTVLYQGETGEAERSVG